MFVLSCVLINLCGYFFDRSKKNEDSLQELTARSADMESAFTSNGDESSSERREQSVMYKQRLSSVVENTSDCVGIAEPTGRYVYMNRSFRNMLELSDDDLNDSHMFEWHAENNRKMLLGTALPSASRDGVWIGESTLLTRTGNVIPVVLSISAHKDLAGKVEYYSTTIRQSSTIQVEEEAKLSRLLLRKTMQVQEIDRRQLAKELHDGLGQSLYSIVLGMQYLQGNSEGDQNKQLIQQWIDELHRALSIVKLFALQLRPHTLDQLGLSSAIEQLISRTSAVGSNLNVVHKSNLAFGQRFSEEIEICLYRIMQEAMHNLLKYAKANNVEISLVCDDTSIQLIVKDDGCGFKRDKEQEGLGLQHMEERTYALQGTIDIQSIVCKGTTISVAIPLKEKQR